MNRQSKADPWWEFDFFWEQKKEELERMAWNCKGVFGRLHEPFPADVLEMELHKELLKWQEEQILKLFGVPEEYLGGALRGIQMEEG